MISNCFVLTYFHQLSLNIRLLLFPHFTCVFVQESYLKGEGKLYPKPPGYSVYIVTHRRHNAT